MIVLAILLPPVAVALETESMGKTLLNILLTACLWIPGSIHAVVVVRQSRAAQAVERARVTAPASGPETVAREYRGTARARRYQAELPAMTAAGWEVVNVTNQSLPIPGKIIVTYKRG